ncbi:ribonuclease E/G [Parvibaculum sp.]|uniref:Rne/Rng family ribonuclease n=1 Tax=Parvibaculum sp. TaxID=2024848 RepID=UPI001B1C0A20|nr:ribonuclease E/G [Parvibaculum sp.]MBO6667475.1 ribonuclease E/G [Parvibaculum sp.]MBO6692224.1 ribonuclease E/G [Parvibaculum sp.]MBO6714027.1 ribonuclease E/G [Parvibaculum sp.]
MGKKMLIDAAHPEETRVVVVSGNRVEEFDFESENRKQLRGNIYLAKVTRVEPSLQAAFVEYGGNRHGFLAFSEIHPDYYQIPVADREALLKQQADEARREEEEEDEEEAAETAKAAEAKADEAGEDDAEENGDEQTASADKGETDTVQSDETVESVGAEDAMEEAAPRKQRINYRSYKIQEVIKRRQIILVQVVKEERGNKGAALTTYLSLAGRYCVLMPNTARGGGISRKITVAADRKKLKGIAESFDVPEGMGLIIRTAGAKRTKAEIKRDYEYLLRMWESVRELTLKSTAPTLVYEEGSLIKRSIRDLYDKDIDNIQIEGDEGYKEAKNFMRMLMPSHAKNVQPYKEKQPLFQKFQVEQQLDAMLNPTVTLKSGGYVVINPTEALVSIDVNSGRSTKERNIEQTALKTNLEAAEEIARQMRLRDLAGLIVIDFIDMDENRNNRAVERKLKDCLKTDRARIQVGRISHFGLLEMSRQRMRSGVLEGSTVICPHCSGTGLVRSVESMALHVLRGVEAEAIKGRAAAFTVKVPAEVAIYILNQKRANLLDVEERYGTSVYIEADATLAGSEHKIETAEARALTRTRPALGAINVESGYTEEEEEPVVEETSDEDETEETASDVGEDKGDGQRRRKRRRRKRRPGSEGDAQREATGSEDEPEGEAAAEEAEATSAEAEQNDDDKGESEIGEDGQPRKRRRRGRRGGRRNRRRQEDELSAEGSDGEDLSLEDEVDPLATGEAPVLLSYSRSVLEAEDQSEDDEETWDAEAAIEGAYDEPSELLEAEAEAKEELAEEEAAEEAEEDGETAEAPGETEEPEAEEPEAEEPEAEETAPEEAEQVIEMAEAAADDVPMLGDIREEKKPSGPSRRGWWQRR